MLTSIPLTERNAGNTVVVALSTVFLYSTDIVPTPPPEPFSFLPAAAAEPVRKIIHCDCDCFYAAVEMRDDPSLRGRPLAVGGRPETRGVVATCNYEARSYGVHSAMSSAMAMRRCPDLLILPPSMDRYRLVSRQIMAIYLEYTTQVEPLSLDEAYLDVSASPNCGGSATRMAQQIRERVAREVGVTVSAGVAPNKFVAKIASDWRKPDGLFIVRPHQVDAFVAALPVSKLFGVGKVMAARFEALGVTTCGDLRAWSKVDLHRHFGSFGQRLFELCRGLDTRQVEPNRERKSISVETTYVTDLPSFEVCATELTPLLSQLAKRMENSIGNRSIHKLFLKIRFADFKQTTVECISDTLRSDLIIDLLRTGLERNQQPVRLLGVGVRLTGNAESIVQEDLFD